MEIVLLLAFLSLCLVSLSVGAFVYSAHQGDLEQSDRLALAPLAREQEGRP